MSSEYAPPFAVMESDWFDGLYDTLFDAPASELAELARALGGHVDQAAHTAISARGRKAVDAYREALALVARLRTLPPLAFEPWSSDPKAEPYAKQLQRLLWALENDLTTAAFVDYGGAEDGPWDTHHHNQARQTELNARALPLLARFLSELASRRGPHGRLIEQAVVVMGSEIGRFPRLNDDLGKDHFPEGPVLLAGAGLVAGRQIGATDREMASLPVSATSGRYERGGVEIALDDIGATLLHLAGANDPTLYGYQGRVLPVLLP
jgi:uncharacterized protein (DUF1501 family)